MLIIRIISTFIVLIIFIFQLDSVSDIPIIDDESDNEETKSPYEVSNYIYPSGGGLHYHYIRSQKVDDYNRFD